MAKEYKLDGPISITLIDGINAISTNEIEILDGIILCRSKCTLVTSERRQRELPCAVINLNNVAFISGAKIV